LGGSGQGSQVQAPMARIASTSGDFFGSWPTVEVRTALTEVKSMPAMVPANSAPSALGLLALGR